MYSDIAQKKSSTDADAEEHRMSKKNKEVALHRSVMSLLINPAHTGSTLRPQPACIKTKTLKKRAARDFTFNSETDHYTNTV